MTPRVRNSLIASLLIHLSFGLILPKAAPPGQPGGGNSPKPTEESGDGTGKSDEPIKMKTVDPRSPQGELLSPVGPNGEPCYEYFGGLGFYYDGGDMITQVMPGYPAARAGLQRGDQISNMHDIMGEIGTPVTFMYTRGGVTRTLTLKREKICMRSP